MKKIVPDDKRILTDEDPKFEPVSTENSSLQHVQAVTHIYQAESIDRLLKLLSEYLESIGFYRITYHIFPGFGEVEESDSTRFYAHNVPQDIIDTYLALYKDIHDPMIALVYKLGKPILLSQTLSAQEEEGSLNAATTAATLDLLGEGLGIPLFGPNFLRGYLFTSTGDAEQSIPADIECKVHHVATAFHNRYAVLQNRLQRQVKLTSRELETLELVVMGRKNSDIARALGISTHTVDSYLRRIYLKLGTTDRVTTSIRALQFNLLQGNN